RFRPTRCSSGTSRAQPGFDWALSADQEIGGGRDGAGMVGGTVRSREAAGCSEDRQSAPLRQIRAGALRSGAAGAGDHGSPCHRQGFRRGLHGGRSTVLRHGICAGLAITQYCDEKRLSAGERLLIFTKVCEGVQHAHQKAIIHRDLKPSNILVVEVDGKPVPRIIDFGLAKAISQQAPGGTLVTRAGGLVGTPGYMSPEQMDPLVADVDTRSDVYALGVVLYELLIGVMAQDTQQWESKPFHEVLRQVHEDEPTSPSTRLSNNPAAAAIADKRSTDPRQLANMLRGDLDWITLKALERDRARRYGSPAELAADIGRYLRNEPVV